MKTLPRMYSGASWANGDVVSMALSRAKERLR
jgi:hypothetical protein